MRYIPFLPRYSSLPNPSHLAGIALLGLVFPEIGSLLCASQSGDLTIRGVLTAQCSFPALWLLDVVPIALVIASWKVSVVSDPTVPVADLSNVIFLQSRIEDLESEISRRDLQLEEISVLLGLSSQIRQSLLETLLQPCFVLDSDGKITEANEEFWQLTPAGTNPNLSFYADQILNVEVHPETEGEESVELELGLMSQNDVCWVSFRLRPDLPPYVCEIRRLGENGGPIGSLWLISPDARTQCVLDPPEGIGEDTEPQTAPISFDTANDEMSGFCSADAFRERMNKSTPDQYSSDDRYPSS